MLTGFLIAAAERVLLPAEDAGPALVAEDEDDEAGAWLDTMLLVVLRDRRVLTLDAPGLPLRSIIDALLPALRPLAATDAAALRLLVGAASSGGAFVGEAAPVVTRPARPRPAADALLEVPEALDAVWCAAACTGSAAGG